MSLSRVSRRQRRALTVPVLSPPAPGPRTAHGSSKRVAPSGAFRLSLDRRPGKRADLRQTDEKSGGADPMTEIAHGTVNPCNPARPFFHGGGGRWTGSPSSACWRCSPSASCLGFAASHAAGTAQRPRSVSLRDPAGGFRGPRAGRHDLCLDDRAGHHPAPRRDRLFLRGWERWRCCPSSARISDRARHGWYSLGFASVQPPEFLKPMFVVFTAWMIRRQPGDRRARRARPSRWS